MSTLGAMSRRGIVRAPVRNIRESLVLTFGYNALGILYAFSGWLLSPMIAALAMSFSSVSVISNALRLRTADVRT